MVHGRASDSTGWPCASIVACALRDCLSVCLRELLLSGHYAQSDGQSTKRGNLHARHRPTLLPYKCRLGFMEQIISFLKVFKNAYTLSFFKLKFRVVR